MFSVYCLSCRQFSFESILICKTLLHGALSSLYIYHISDIALHVFICSRILSCFSSEFPLIKLSVKYLLDHFQALLSSVCYCGVLTSLFHQAWWSRRKNVNNTKSLAAWEKKKENLLCAKCCLWFTNAAFPVIQEATLVV